MKLEIDGRGAGHRVTPQRSGLESAFVRIMIIRRFAALHPGKALHAAPGLAFGTLKGRAGVSHWKT